MSEEKTLTALVVCDIFKLSKHEGEFSSDTKFAKLKNKAHLITREYADEMNEMWKNTGIKCVIDEEASEDAAEAMVVAAAIRLKNDKAQVTAAKAVASMALGANEANPVEDELQGSMMYSVKELEALESLKDMTDEELDEFFKTETRKSGKSLLGELIVSNNGK